MNVFFVLGRGTGIKLRLRRTLVLLLFFQPGRKGGKHTDHSNLILIDKARLAVSSLAEIEHAVVPPHTQRRFSVSTVEKSVLGTRVRRNDA